MTVLHDPLCPYVQTAHQRDHVACQCGLIAKVREDERANVTAEFMSNHGGRWEYKAGVAAGRAEALGIRVREVMPYANGYFDGEDHMLAKCIAAVEALDVCWYVDNACQSPNHGILNDVYLALRALQEKP